jgi:putative ABC transport system permease protein
MLGVKAQVGRVFAPEDRRPGIAEVAVISDGWWQRHYGGDPHVIGKTLRLDDDLYTIIGVAPPGFRHPGRSIETDVEIWCPAGWIGPPFPTTPNRRAYFLRGAIARLEPGVTPAVAQARLEALGLELRRQYPGDYPASDGWAPRVLPLQDDLVGSARPALMVLLAAVGFVLLIACANVANLMLAKASTRRREIAVRQALGAGRGRLVRQLLTESVLLALCGGAVGLALSSWGIEMLVRLSPANLPRLPEVGVDVPVLLFALTASILTGLVFGIAPALQAAGAGLSETLKESARGSGGASGRRLGSLLVIYEFALALVLLIGAALLVRTLWRLQRVDPGFQPRGLTMASLWLPQPNVTETGRYFKNAAQVALYRRLLERVRAIPGVTQVAGATRTPFSRGATSSPFQIEGRDPDHGGTGGTELSSTSTDYFATMGIALLRGRLFTEEDQEEAQPVAIVSDSLARRFFPGEDALGRRVRLPSRTGAGPWMTIVGVAHDVKTQALDADERPVLYRPLLQASSLALTLVVRGSQPPAALGAAIEGEVRALDRELPIYAVRTMGDAMAATVAQRRFAMQLLGLFAAAALLLSAIGIYGVIAYNVAQRTREIGIRMALGARPTDVRRLLLTHGARLAALGVAIGLAGALLLTRAMRALLYGVSPRDPMTFAAIAGLLGVVALLASYLPARRASRIDPLEALRME